jgi:hypothetical protein
MVRITRARYVHPLVQSDKVSQRMNFEIYNWTAYASYLSTLIPLTLILIIINRQPIGFKWLAIFLTLSLVSDLLFEFVAYYKLGNGNIIGNSYLLFSIPFISIFFNYTFEGERFKRALISINVFYVLFSITNFVFIQKLGINSYNLTLQSFIILVFSILYFYSLLKQNPPKIVHNLPVFWMVSGLFFSHAGKIVVYSVTHYLVNFIKDNLILVWSFHNVLSIVGNMLITVGVVLIYRMRSVSSS